MSEQVEVVPSLEERLSRAADRVGAGLSVDRAMAADLRELLKNVALIRTVVAWLIGELNYLSREKKLREEAMKGEVE